MKTLNLVYPGESDIKYVISRFPDGQQQVTLINDEDFFKDEEYSFGGIQRRTDVKIISRLNNFLDLELIICCVQSLRHTGFENINLYIPYLLGSRSDRKFSDTSNHYLKDVLSPILNSLNLETIEVMDVHSDVAGACIDNLKVIDNIQLVQHFLLDRDEELKSKYENFILISPDGGSLKKIYKVADAIDYKKDIICCSKSRDNDGILSKVKVPMDNLLLSLDKDAVIIDDICDAGTTFINIAKELKENGFKNKIYLIVTHGIFSKGLSHLSKYFDNIYCTNSYRNINSMNEFGMHNEKFLNKIKQLEIFK